MNYRPRKIKNEATTKTGVKLRVVVDNTVPPAARYGQTFRGNLANQLNLLADQIDRDIERILRK